MEGSNSSGHIQDRRKSGILKKHTSEMETDSPTNQQHHHVHVSDHVHFDEEIIAEHDLDRGTRMKIDEPKTPFQPETEAVVQEGT